MAYSLCRLTRVRAALVVLAATVASGQLPAAKGQMSEVGGQKSAGKSPTPTSDLRPPAGDSGQSLMADAARRLAAEPRISADLRYRINAFDQELVGTGRYLQLIVGTERLVRLELRLQVGDKTAVVQEIRGRDAYWVRRDVPPTPPTLGRVDLRQLRKSLHAPAVTPISEVMPQDGWIMSGGLARLLTTVEQNFDFAAPRAEELQFNSADGKSIVRMPIWRVEGAWKPERLASLIGHQPKATESLPQQLPDRVELILGRNEDILPRFPYRVTYWKSPPVDPKQRQAGPPAAIEMLTLELFNVSRRAIDEREFEYQPGDQRVEELTQQYAQRLSGEAKAR